MNKEEIIKATMIGFYNKANQASHYAIPPSFPPITKTIYFNDKGEVIREKDGVIRENSKGTGVAGFP